jgi:hypothetical protein
MALTIYTERDLRAVDRLALVLFGVGIVLVIIAVFAGTDEAANTALFWIGAVSSFSLGSALTLKIRQLRRNRNSDAGPRECDEVFE